jgi:hypothetical protein
MDAKFLYTLALTPWWWWQRFVETWVGVSNTRCIDIFFCKEPRSRYYRRIAALRFIVQPCDENYQFYFFSFFRVMEHRWTETDRGKPKYLGKEPVSVPLCPPQIKHGLTWDRTRASAVRGRWLTAWAMARPMYICLLCAFVCVIKFKVAVTSCTEIGEEMNKVKVEFRLFPS